MPEYVVERIGEALNTKKKAINGARIHLFGIAYKKDVSDMRESPALDILQLAAPGAGGTELIRTCRRCRRAPCACSRLPKTPWTGLTAR